MSKLTYPDDYRLRLAPDLPKYFSDEIIDGLMARFEIPENLRTHFFNMIDMTAREILRHKDYKTGKRTSKQVTAELTKIRDRSKALLELMDSISRQARDAIGTAEHQTYLRVMEEAPQELLNRRAIVPFDDAAEGCATHTYYDVEPALGYLAYMSERSLEHVRKGSPGRLWNYHLDHFARIFCRFWVESLGRPLTHATHKGEGLTEADAFVAAVLEPLSPEEIPALNTAIEKARQKYRPSPN